MSTPSPRFISRFDGEAVIQAAVGRRPDEGEVLMWVELEEGHFGWTLFQLQDVLNDFEARITALENP